MSELWLIWSEEHGAWWKPARTGYTTSIAQAGRYSEAAAREIETRANIPTPPPHYHEIAIPDPVPAFQKTREDPR